MNDELMKLLGFGQEVEQVKRGNCPICEKKVDETKFRTQTDLNEFGISGLCQSCQDLTFGGPPAGSQFCDYWGCIDVGVGIQHHPNCGDDPTICEPEGNI